MGYPRRPNINWIKRAEKTFTDAIVKPNTTAVYGFISNIWKVHHPSCETEAERDIHLKPEAHLPAPENIEDGERDLKDEEVMQQGVAIAEATYAVTGYTWYFIMACLWVAYFIFALDNQMTSTYSNSALTMPSYLKKASMPSYNTAYASQQTIIAVAKLFIAKLADIFGRFAGFTLTMIFYTIGFIIMAASNDTVDYTAGSILYGLGNSGLQIMMWIVLADFLSARQRTFGVAFITLPIFITFAVGPKILKGLNTPPGEQEAPAHWRWLPGMFCILAPVCLTPIIIMMYHLERKAKKNDLVPKHPYLRRTIWYALKQFLLDVDIVGLIFLLAGFVLLDVALVYGGLDFPQSWSKHWIIAFLTVGCALIVVIMPIYEYFLASRPIVRRSWLNSDVVLAIVIGFLDFCVFQTCFWLTFYWIRISKGIMDQDDATYFVFTDTLSLTLFGVIGGLIIYYTRRYKYLMIAGAGLRMLGFGLMIRYRNVDVSMVQAVWPQIIMGMGGAFLGEIVTMSSQVTVRHQDVAMVTAVVLTFTALGNSIGQPVYTTIMNSQMPKALDAYAPFLSGDKKTFIAQSPLMAFSKYKYSLDALEGRAIATAFNESGKHVLYFCLGISAGIFVLTFFMRDWVLPSCHNVVSTELPEKNMMHMRSDKTYENAILEEQVEVERVNMDPPSYHESTTDQVEQEPATHTLVPKSDEKPKAKSKEKERLDEGVGASELNSSYNSRAHKLD